MSRRTTRLLGGVATLGLLVLMPGSAQAGVIASAGPTFPTTVTVGQTGIAASITLENRNSQPNTGDTNTVCNAGEASPPCASPELGIVLVPTCKVLASGQCTAAGADPGVFALSATGTGRLGTSCAGMSFTITTIDATFGTVRFTPQPAGAHVTLPGFGSSCVIDFTFSVIKSPTGDQNPTVPGVQTAQATEHTQFAGAFGPGALSNFARGTSNGTTVVRAGPPTITTNASANVPIGGQVTDQATVSGLVNPVPGATVTFNLYPPADTVCSGAPEYTNVQVVTLNGTTATATSAPYQPSAAGVYHWVATYNGDANNLAVSGRCNDANESVTVAAAATPPPPPPPPPAADNLPEVCTTPPGPAPAGGVLCARGTAAIAGRTGCQGTAFNVVVSGRQIERVVFSLDGRVVRTLSQPNSGTRYTLPVNPRAMRTGVHRVLARTTFRSQSGTKARVLRVTFSRCARRAASPEFTG